MHRLNVKYVALDIVEDRKLGKVSSISVVDFAYLTNTYQFLVMLFSVFELVERCCYDEHFGTLMAIASGPPEVVSLMKILCKLIDYELILIKVYLC